MNSDTSSVLGIISILVSVSGVIYSAINHKKIRSRCCGKNIEMSIDIDPSSQRTIPKEATSIEVDDYTRRSHSQHHDTTHHANHHIEAHRQHSPKNSHEYTGKAKYKRNMDMADNMYDDIP
jgi:hypothetical protein